MHMARLNEPTAAVDTLDALKRRFIRQNREIARVNSTQSVRIRNLEGDVSRLLSENIALRERVINLQYKVDKRPGRAILDDMGIVKERLEAKLIELGGLVQELGNLTVAVERIPPPERNSTDRDSAKRSPDQKNWRQGLTFSELTGGVEGRLPPILEDKYFPRKTLDTEELSGMFPDQANVTDSPDLGPPPVVHFEDGEPGAFEKARDLNKKNESAQRTLFANLETRKRRRETSNIAQSNTHEVIDPQPIQPRISLDKVTPPLQSLKSGAKRKMTPADDDSRSDPEKSTQAEDVMSNHKVIMIDLNKSVSAKSNAPRAENFNIQKTRESREEGNQGKAREAKVAVVTKNRQALGPKSTNTDPTSPIKRSKVLSTEKSVGDRDDVAKKIQGRSRLKDKPPNKPNPSSNEKAPSNIDPKVEADNPGPPSHNISPPDSPQPPAARQTSRDTPPPPDPKADVTDLGACGTAGRATRRPRGSVSYAEPNLRDKMRRPTSDLIDAVATVEKSKEPATVKPKENKVGAEPASEESAEVAKKECGNDGTSLCKIRSSKVNRDQDHGSIDESAAAARRKNAAAPADLPTSLVADRRRRTVGYQQNGEDGIEQEIPQLHPGAGSAIAALMAGSQRPRRREEETKTKEEPVDAQEIYELSRSSPADLLENDDENVKEAAKVTVATKNSRRHSSMAAREGVDASRDGNARLMVRRNEGKKETLGTNAKRDGTTELKSARSAAALGQGEEAAIERAERLAVRRRSMMI